LPRDFQRSDDGVNANFQRSVGIENPGAIEGRLGSAYDGKPELTDNVYGEP